MAYVHVFTPTILNELRLGYTRRKVQRLATQLDAPPSQSLQIPGIPTNGAFEDTLPTFAIGGLQQLGPSANTASDFRTDVTQIFDAISMQRGRHSIKFGIDWRWERLDVIQPPSPTGNFSNEAITIVSQTNDGPVGIAGSVLTSGIISHVVFLYLNHCHALSFDYVCANPLFGVFSWIAWWTSSEPRAVATGPRSNIELALLSQ